MCGSGSSGMPCMCHVAVYGLLLDTSFIYGLLWSHTLPHTTTSSYLTRNASFHQPKLQFLFQWCHTLRKNACEKANFCLEKGSSTNLSYSEPYCTNTKSSCCQNVVLTFLLAMVIKKNSTVYTLHILFGKNEWYCQS